VELNLAQCASAPAARVRRGVRGRFPPIFVDLPLALRRRAQHIKRKDG
jgi:hypothetical protein